MVTTQQATDLNTVMKVAEHLLFPSRGKKSVPVAIVGASGIGKTAALTALANRREYTVSTSFEELKEGRHRPDRPTLYILKGLNRGNHDLQRELAALLTRRNHAPVVIELTHEELQEGNLNAELCNALTWLYVRPEPAQWVQGMHTEWGMASSVFPASPYAHLIADFISTHPQYLTWYPEPTISYIPESLAQTKTGADASKKACRTNGEDGKPTVTYNGALQRNFVFQSIMNPNQWKHLGVDLSKVEFASYRRTDLSPARWSNLALALENLPLIEELKPLSPEVEALITGAVGAEVADEFKRFISGHRRLWLPYLHLLDDQDLLRAPASVLGSNGSEVCARVCFYVSQMCNLWATGPTRWDEDFEESEVSTGEFLEVVVRLVSLVILGSMERGKYYNPYFVQGVLPAVEKVRKVVFETSAHLAASDVPAGLVPPGLIDFLKEFLGSGEDICDAGGLKLYSLFEYMDALVNTGG
jgi:hypothetical protein